MKYARAIRSTRSTWFRVFPDLNADLDAGLDAARDPRPGLAIRALPLPDAAQPPVAARPLLRAALAGLIATALVACGGGASEPAEAEAGGDPAQEAAVLAPADAEPDADATPGVRIDTAVATAPSRPAGVSPSRQTTTASAAPTTTVAAATVNSLDTIVADMRLQNDLTLRGYENRTVGWYVGPGYNQMGNDPRSSNTANWFKKAYPGFINDTYMRAVLPWLVLFDGEGHAATNTRVHVRNIRAFYKSRRTGQWISYGSSPGASGYGTPKTDLFGGSLREDKRTNADGSVEIKPPADANYAWHGWWALGRVTIDPTDIAAMFVTLQARLVVDDAARPDDRSQARLLVQVGADYYPDKSTGWPGANPAVATSRVKRVKNDWQSFNMTTFSDVGVQDPGGGITESAFRAAPPPME